MGTDALAALGAFLSGVASVVTAAWYVRRARREWEEECRARLEAFKAGLHEMDTPHD